MSVRSSLSLSSFAKFGAWRVVAEPTVLTWQGRPIGTFTPSIVDDDAIDRGAGVRVAYRPEASIALEVARLAVELADARLELAELRNDTLPDAADRRREHVRHRERLRRLTYLADLRTALREQEERQ